jgi:Flp pilus assembly protein TadD
MKRYKFIIPLLLTSLSTGLILSGDNEETIDFNTVKEELISGEISQKELENTLEKANGSEKYYEIIDLFKEDVKEKYFTPGVLNEIGVAYYNAGDTYKAFESFNNAIEKDPTYGEPYANLGLIYRVKGRYEQAREYFEKALELMTDNPTLYFNLGVLYNRLGEEELEESMYRKAIEVDADYGPAYRRFAILLIKQKRYVEAVNIVRRYSQIAEDNEEVKELVKDITSKLEEE